MKIEDLFKEKMSNAKQKAPENLWNKIENNLNNTPQSTNIDTNAQNIITNASSTLTTTLTKVIATTLGIVATSVGGYLIYDNLQEEPKSTEIITQTKTETPKNTEQIINPTSFISTNTTPISKPEIKETITPNEITPIDTSKAEIEISQPVEETIIINNPITQTETTPSQTPIVENKPIEENIIEEEQSPKTPKEEFNPQIKRPNFISPNNDGINDVFKIKNLEAYPENEIIIFDQRGRIIFQAAPYNNDWDAANTQQGTYFYKLLIKEGQNKKIYNGSITIML